MEAPQKFVVVEMAYGEGKKHFYHLESQHEMTFAKDEAEATKVADRICAESPKSIVGVFALTSIRTARIEIDVTGIEAVKSSKRRRT